VARGSGGTLDTGLTCAAVIPIFGGGATAGKFALRAFDSARGILKLPVDEVWGNSSTLARHFRDHAADFGSATIDDYVDEASGFFQRGLQTGLPTKIDADGIIRIYDPATNTFGAFNPSGTIRTFFKPSSSTYWSTQSGASPW
jgi:hypothetical protein